MAQCTAAAPRLHGAMHCRRRACGAPTRRPQQVRPERHCRQPRGLRRCCCAASAAKAKTPCAALALCRRCRRLYGILRCAAGGAGGADAQLVVTAEQTADCERELARMRAAALQVGWYGRRPPACMHASKPRTRPLRSARAAVCAAHGRRLRWTVNGQGYLAALRCLVRAQLPQRDARETVRACAKQCALCKRETVHFLQV